MAAFKGNGRLIEVKIIEKPPRDFDYWIPDGGDRLIGVGVYYHCYTWLSEGFVFKMFSAHMKTKRRRLSSFSDGFVWIVGQTVTPPASSLTRICLNCKLVPVQNREYQCGLSNTKKTQSLIKDLALTSRYFIICVMIYYIILVFLELRYLCHDLLHNFSIFRIEIFVL